MLLSLTGMKCVDLKFAKNNHLVKTNMFGKVCNYTYLDSRKVLVECLSNNPSKN